MLGVSLLCCCLFACSNSSTEPVPDQAPDTSIVSAPRSDIPNSYRVSIAWLGNDPDGQVASFQWRMSDDGADGVVDPQDTLGLAWHSTAISDSTFDTSAELDSFAADVANPAITDPIDFRNWQVHTFFVRAVDQHGNIDPTPASVTFTVTTVLPQVEFDLPTLSEDVCQATNTTVGLGIETSDEDDPLKIASEFRYAWVPVQDLDPSLFDGTGVSPPQAGDCLTRAQYEMLDSTRLFTESDWSSWMPFEITSRPEVDLSRSTLSPGSSWFLAVQARDRAKAVTTTFRWNRNLFHFHVDGGFFPALHVTDPSAGERDFEGEATTAVNLGAYGDSTLTFSWTASAESYAGVISDYRYAFDAADPLNVEESEWDTPWANASSTSVQLDTGAHNLAIAVRDNSGAITRAVYLFSVN
ncbi:MAG TPA: hypothetical protein VKA63_09960 [Candidatus Krumholzibacteria bacterium]|nr:hypothetical protein [Candidatus Krumholzibacteria bacterium]